MIPKYGDGGWVGDSTPERPTPALQLITPPVLKPSSPSDDGFFFDPDLRILG